MKIELTNEDVEAILESLRYSRARIEGNLSGPTAVAPIEVRGPKLDHLNRISDKLRAAKKTPSS